MNWRFAIPGVVFVVLFGMFWFVLHRNEQGYDIHEIQSPLIGKVAPQFELSQVEDPAKTVQNKSFAGLPYIVNVWGTWCAGCRQEHATLLEIARLNAVPIIGIDWNDDLTAAQRWLSTLGNPYVATGFDNQGKVAIDWGVYGAPETFLVDANGTVQYKHVAPLTMDVWQREFMPRIQQMQASASASK